MYRSQVGAHPTLVQSAVNMVLVPKRRVERWNITVEALDQPVSQLVKYIGLTDNSSKSSEGVMDVVGYESLNANLRLVLLTRGSK
jgi:hypothetical protein